MRSPSRSAVAWGISGMLAVAALSAALWRLQFGVDVTDEAFHVAMTVRFANGARPFLDEFNLAQISALFVTPFVRLYLFIASLDGVVLFTRILNLTIRVGTAGAVYLGSRRVVPGPLALAGSLLSLLFIPVNLPNNSYNMLGMAGLTAGCFLSLASQAEGRRWCDVAAGVCHAVAAASYPPFALPVAVFGVARLIRRPRAAALYIAGAAIPFLFLLVFALDGGLDGVLRSLRYASSSDPRSTTMGSALTTGVISLLASSPRRLLVLAAAGALCLSAFRRLSPLRYAAVAIPLLAATAAYAGATTTHGTITWIALPGALAIVPLVRDANSRALFWMTIVPGAAAGLLSAVFSSNGYLNFAVGGFVAAQGALILLLRVTGSLSAGVLTAALAAGVLVVQQFAPGAMYRDDDAAVLEHRIGSGAFAGLRTTHGKARFLSALERDVREQRGETILFYYDFPAGYLLTDKTSLVSSAWTFRHLLPVEYYESAGRWPDLVVRIRSFRHTSRWIRHDEELPDPLGPEIAARYRRAVLRDEYEILIRREPGL